MDRRLALFFMWLFRRKGLEGGRVEGKWEEWDLSARSVLSGLSDRLLPLWKPERLEHC